jgi:hypothetical protein
MSNATRTVREQAFDPLECSIPEDLTIAEYRNRRAGDAALPAPERRAPRLRLRKLIRR